MGGGFCSLLFIIKNSELGDIMALTDTEKLRLELGLTDPRFPIFCDDELQYFLEKNNNNIGDATLDAAKSALQALAFMPTRERAGDEEVWIDAANAYRKALELIVSRPNAFNRKVLTPYAAGISKADIAKYKHSDIVDVGGNLPKPCNGCNFWQSGGCRRDNGCYIQTRV